MVPASPEHLTIRFRGAYELVDLRLNRAVSETNHYGNGGKRLRINGMSMKHLHEISNKNNVYYKVKGVGGAYAGQREKLLYYRFRQQLFTNP